MPSNPSEWTLEFAGEQVDDSLARLIDKITPGLVERLATDSAAYGELITAWEIIASSAEEQLAEAVLSARQSGYTWEQVGKALGIDRQAAQQRFTGTQRADLAERFRRVEELESSQHNAVPSRSEAQPLYAPIATDPRLTVGAISAPIEIGREETVITKGGSYDEDEFLARATAHGWVPVSMGKNSVTCRLDNQQWDFKYTLFSRPPRGEGWQRIPRDSGYKYWVRPTGQPVPSGTPALAELQNPNWVKLIANAVGGF